MISPGNVIRIPKGARMIRQGDEGARDEAYPARVERVVVVTYVYLNSDEVFFYDRRGKQTWATLSNVELIDTGDHRLTVYRRKLGGHPNRCYDAAQSVWDERGWGGL